MRLGCLFLSTIFCSTVFGMSQKHDEQKSGGKTPFKNISEFLTSLVGACGAELKILNNNKESLNALVEEPKEVIIPKQNINGSHFPDGMGYSKNEMNFLKSVISAGLKSMENEKVGPVNGKNKSDKSTENK